MKEEKKSLNVLDYHRLAILSLALVVIISFAMAFCISKNKKEMSEEEKKCIKEKIEQQDNKGNLVGYKQIGEIEYYCNFLFDNK